jgi:hypothetical protein
MPFLYIDGQLQGDSNPYAARPCEWCGDPLPEYDRTRRRSDDDPIYFATRIDDPEGRRVAILVCFCKPCFCLYNSMFDSEILELPEDD